MKVHNADVAATQAAMNAATSLTNTETTDDGFVRLVGTPGVVISQTGGSDFLTTITGTAPKPVMLWQVADDVAADAMLRAVDVKLSRRRVGGNAAYDGWFGLDFYSIERVYSPDASHDEWMVRRLTDAVNVRASAMTTDEEWVTFALTKGDKQGVTPPGILLGGALVPAVQSVSYVPYWDVLGLGKAHQRLLLVSMTAYGGSNTNYAIINADAAATEATTAGVGTLYHRTLNTSTIIGATWAKVSSATGMWAIKFSTASYAATGEILFESTEQFDLGAAPSGSATFVIHKVEPPNTSITVYASDDAGLSWIEVVDGDVATDVGLASQQTYEMKASFASNAANDATPILQRMGVEDLTSEWWTEFATWSDVEESVEPLSGKYALPQATLRLDLTGARDYEGVERFFSENHFTAVEIRCWIGAADLSRDQWMLRAVWDIDDPEFDATSATFVCVSPLARLKGQYPAPVAGEPGWILKAATSDLTGGADFSNEVSEDTETPSTLVVSIAGSATEVSYWFTPAGVPNLLRWAPGDWSITVPVDTGEADISLKIRLTRVNASGTVQESTAYTELQALAAATGYVYGINNVAWTSGAATDRLRIDASFTNANVAARTVTLALGDSDAEVLAPWTATQAQAPSSFSAIALGTAWSQWVALTGLPARYIGAPPASTVKISKEVVDADGAEELERIARVDGGTNIDSQGRVRYASILKARSEVRYVFPREERRPAKVSMGFSMRAPRFDVPFGWNGGQFRGRVLMEHAAALAAYGVSRLDNRNPVLDAEVAKYIIDETTAIDVGRDTAAAFGVGYITGELAPTIPHPEAEIGDCGVFMTDRLVVKDPSTAAAIRGWTWCYGVIIALRGLWGDGVTMLVRGLADVAGVGATVTRRDLYEAALVVPIDRSPPGAVGNARIELSAHPSGATISYYYAAVSEAAPARNAVAWTTGVATGTTVTLARDAAARRILYAFATYQNQQGVIVPTIIAPDATASIGTLTPLESGTTPNITVTITASDADTDTREIAYYGRIHATNWPTVDGTEAGEPDPAYFLRRLPVDANLNGIDNTGAACAGGLIAVTVTTAAATTDKVKSIAVPTDYNGNRGTPITSDYTVTNAASPAYTAGTWAVNTAGSSPSVPRTYDIDLTPNGGVSDVTHDLVVQYSVDGGAWTTLYSESNASSGCDHTNEAVPYYADAAGPGIQIRFQALLKSGAAVLQTLALKPGAGDDFAGYSTVS